MTAQKNHRDPGAVLKRAKKIYCTDKLFTIDLIKTGPFKAYFENPDIKGVIPYFTNKRKCWKFCREHRCEMKTFSVSFVEVKDAKGRRHE